MSSFEERDRVEEECIDVGCGCVDAYGYQVTVERSSSLLNTSNGVAQSQRVENWGESRWHPIAEMMEQQRRNSRRSRMQWCVELRIDGGT